MLPDLMTARQAKQAAAGAADTSMPGPPEFITTDMVDEWVSLGIR